MIPIKLHSDLVLYGDPPPPSPLWSYKCRNCIWYEVGKCKIIRGYIEPDKWCILWLPMYPPFVGK